MSSPTPQEVEPILMDSSINCMHNGMREAVPKSMYSTKHKQEWTTSIIDHCAESWLRIIFTEPSFLRQLRATKPMQWNKASLNPLTSCGGKEGLFLMWWHWISPHQKYIKLIPVCLGSNMWTQLWAVDPWSWWSLQDIRGGKCLFFRKLAKEVNI